MPTVERKQSSKAPCIGRRDRDARARGRFQRVVGRLKCLRLPESVGHPRANVATKQLSVERKPQNINLIQSVWRRIKKEVKVRDLRPVKDVKGGSGVTGESKPITRGRGTTGTTSHPKKDAVTIYEIRPRVDGNGCDLISDVLRFGRLWFAGPNAIANAIKSAKFYSRSHDAVIRVYNEAGEVIDRHAQIAGDFKEW